MPARTYAFTSARMLFTSTTLVKAYVLEGDDGLRSGSKKRLFFFSQIRVECLLVVGRGLLQITLGIV